MLLCDTAAGSRGGFVEWMETGAELGPASYWFLLCLSSEKACCNVIAPADWENPNIWPGV